MKVLMTTDGGATPPLEAPHVRHIRIDATKLAQIVWPQNAWVCVGCKADAYYSLCPEGGWTCSGGAKRKWFCPSCTSARSRSQGDWTQWAAPPQTPPAGSQWSAPPQPPPMPPPAGPLPRSTATWESFDSYNGRTEIQLDWCRGPFIVELGFLVAAGFVRSPAPARLPSFLSSAP